MYITFLGIVVTGAVAGQATYQDTDSHISDLFYTAPITKFDYLEGRFIGALVVQILIFSSVGIGAYVGMRLPWLDQTRLGPNNAFAYLQPYLILVLPNLVLTTAIFFGLAASWRKMLPVLEDNALGFYVYRLNTPLAPHGRIALEYSVSYKNVGFVNDNPNLDIVNNGIFLNDRYAPFIGYASDIELTDDSTRHKHGLDKAKRMPKLEDIAARNENGISSEADWINRRSRDRRSDRHSLLRHGA
jgi:hypothetical protein